MAVGCVAAVSSGLAPGEELTVVALRGCKYVHFSPLHAKAKVNGFGSIIRHLPGYRVAVVGSIGLAGERLDVGVASVGGCNVDSGI